MNAAEVVWKSIFKVLNDLYRKMKFTVIVMAVLVMFVVFIYAKPQKFSNSATKFQGRGQHYGHEKHGADCFYGRRGPPPRPTAATTSSTTMATTRKTVTTTTTAAPTEAPTEAASPEEPSEGSPETAET